MAYYSISYSLVLVGHIEIQATSKTAAIREFEDTSWDDLIRNYVEGIEADIQEIEKI